jgi:polyphosphate glucokinase
MKSSVKSVLAVDVGGTSVKILATGQSERRSFSSGPTLTPRRMVTQVKKLAGDWTYDVVSIGYPGPVLRGRPIAEPYHLGRGWVGFDFGAGFGCPVKVVNDAAMQALGSYKGGKMLFLGLGTGLSLVTCPTRRAPMRTMSAGRDWSATARSNGVVMLPKSWLA